MATTLAEIEEEVRALSQCVENLFSNLEFYFQCNCLHKYLKSHKKAGR